MRCESAVSVLSEPLCYHSGGYNFVLIMKGQVLRMSAQKMTTREQKEKIKGLFKGYRRMSAAMERELEALGFCVVRTRKHIRIYCNGKRITAPTSASDWRSGPNLASVICRELEKMQND